jgi:hypothetical protein
MDKTQVFAAVARPIVLRGMVWSPASIKLQIKSKVEKAMHNKLNNVLNHG